MVQLGIKGMVYMVVGIYGMLQGSIVSGGLRERESCVMSPWLFNVYMTAW